MANIKELVPQLMDYLGKEELDKAVNISRQIINLQPTSPHFYYNHGMLCIDLGLMDEAAGAFAGAKDRMPECPVIRRMLADVLLETGRFKEGFEHFEWRFNWPLPDSPTPLAPMPAILELLPRVRSGYNKPYWSGEDLHGKSILVFNELGHGDMMQNIRYLPMLKTTGAHVILDAKEEVYRLFKNIKGADEVVMVKKTERIDKFVQTFITKSDKTLGLPPYDYVVSLHSLLHFFDPNLVNIPFEFPYISPQPSDCEAIKVVREHPAKFKVGIVWAGNEHHGSDDARSLFKRDFAPLVHPDMQLFSLQKGKMLRTWPQGKVDLMEGGDIVPSIELGDMLADFNDTAWVLKELDVTVAVDTSICHLAGALDLPVWTILPKRVWGRDRKWIDWRWQRKWYNSQRVRMQTVAGDWRGLLEQVAGELLNLCSDKNSA